MIIYKTINLINGKIYVGKDLVDNPKYLGSGLALKNAINKYGKSNFKKETLEICNSPKELDDREIFWINKLDSTNKKIGYNLTSGGTGGDTFSLLPKEIKIRRVSELKGASKAYNSNPNVKLKQSKIFKDLWKTLEHRIRMEKVLKGRDIAWKDKISSSIKEWHKTKPISKETYQSIHKLNSERSKGRIVVGVSKETEKDIICLYDIGGPKTISNILKSKGVSVSAYIIKRILRKNGLYVSNWRGVSKRRPKLERKT